MDKKIRAILQRFAQGKTTVKENAFLDRWVDKMQVSTLEHLEDTERLELRIKSKIQQHKRQRQRKRTIFKVGAFCVAIALPIALFIWKPLSTHTPLLYTADQDMTVVLEDHSSVTLYKGSSLLVASAFNQENRQVTLKGKADFSVTKNPNLAFIVHTKNIQTTVLGTSFLVDDSDVAYKVKVNYGKVAVLEREHTKLFVLQAKDSIVWKNHQQVANTLNHTQAFFNFKGKEMHQVVAELAAYYQIPIVLQDPTKSHILVQGDYPKKELYAILNSLGFIHNLSIKNKNQTISIQ
ncbi:FecR family protein [Myroides fluvii]|uniref:FecR family protein n=1 Tax=Myroides fluvii TaxID=2572594 RepID=UPI00131E211B|nr:FecR domain-containing protein [Myroides fluvii]